MSSTPSQLSNSDPLQKILDDAENELRRRLEDACEADARGVSTESTEEIRQLEDNLLAAALAAKHTIAVRSQMKGNTHAERERPIKTGVAADDPQARAPRERQAESGVDERGEKDVMGVREFTDDEGGSWRAWSVVPGLSRASSSGSRVLGDFQNGWICFEGLNAFARRRLPFPRAKWPSISDEELRHLLQQAIDAPIRGRKAPSEAPIDHYRS